MRPLRAVGWRRRAVEGQRADVVVDCRWLGHSGVGRVTSVLLEGLAELQPAGRWVLWGPDTVVEHLWGSATWAPSHGSPVRRWAQVGTLRLPDADHVLFLHAVRPLLVLRRTSVVLHDTIPVRHAPGAAQRRLWALFYLASARLADTVLVYSDASAARATDDLGVAPGRLRRFPLTVDPELVSAVRARRARGVGRDRVLLYVGQAKPHKNLRRAVLGFAASRFAATGGRFDLVGFSGDAELEATVAGAGIGGVVVVGRCSDDELVRHLAEATAVIQPSLEEGYGLTVVEALAAGVPVCCSDVPALREAAAGGAELFDPRDPASIARAIDRVTGDAGGGRSAVDRELPTPRDLAAAVVDALDLGHGRRRR